MTERKNSVPPLEEISEYFRIYAWRSGRVLTDADNADGSETYRCDPCRRERNRKR